MGDSTHTVPSTSLRSGGGTIPSGTVSAASQSAIAELPALLPELFINRELSWLDFNSRVLELAGQSSVPFSSAPDFCRSWPRISTSSS